MKISAPAGIEAELRPGLSAADLESCIGDYDGLAVRSATRRPPKSDGEGYALR